jgi:Pentapeptide repeats (8 copies)
MAIPDHIARLMEGVDSWNTWRDEHPEITPDLSGENLFREDLGWANLHGVNLSGANLSGQANLLAADLNGANLQSAQLDSAVLSGSDLRNADLRSANLFGADLQGADLREANLRFTNLLDVDLSNADLTGAFVFGTSAWNLKLEKTKQRDLVITEFNQPPITVDNIEVAQFIHLLLNNEKIHQFVDTITSKAVLILGRFTAERKAVLDAIREELRKSDYLPIVFDFEKPKSRDTDETITLLARMAKFIIADISDAKSVLQELRAIIPDLPSVPVQPIILATQEEPGMFDFYRNRPSFLSVHRYATQEQLLVDLGDKVIRPAELKVLELRG